MSAALPSLKPDKVIRALRRLGFELYRQKGSHMIFVKGTGQVVVPYHKRDLKKGTLFQIIKGTGLTVEQFLDHV